MSEVVLCQLLPRVTIRPTGRRQFPVIEGKAVIFAYAYVVDNDIMFLDIGINNISVVDPLHWETASLQATRLSWPPFGA